MAKVNYNGMMINELLVNGNAKIGKGVYHFSTLPGCNGTCFGTCDGCYAMRGNYRFKSVMNALQIRTDIARNDPQFLSDEIAREIKKHHIEYVRIHASGDFFSADYVKAWISIAMANPNTNFWTYTKSYGHGFDDELNELNSLPNVNIVKSIISGCGFNFGHCDYILDTYFKLKSEGKDPYICKCGFDDTVHCNECTHCSKHEYVLFVEHSTNYKATDDPRFSEVEQIALNQ